MKKDEHFAKLHKQQMDFVTEGLKNVEALLEKLGKYRSFLEEKTQKKENLSLADSRKLLYQISKIMDKIASIPEKIEEITHTKPSEIRAYLENENFFSDEELKVLHELQDKYAKQGIHLEEKPASDAKKAKKAPRNKLNKPDNWLQVD